MNIAQHKGQPRDQLAGPATVSTPRAAVRKSPSPLPSRDVQDRTPERSWSPVRKSRPITRTDHYSFEGSDSSSCLRSSHSSISLDRWPDSPLDFRAAIQVYETEKHFQWRRWGKFQECLLHNMHSSDRRSHHLKAFKIVPARKKRAARASVGSGWRGKDWQGFLDGPTILTGHDGVYGQDSTRA